jgi:prefoldin subunit 5
MRCLFLFFCVAVSTFAQTTTTSQVSVMLQQAQTALDSRRYDVAAPLLEKILASNPPSIIAGVAQELRVKNYQDWFQWLQQSQVILDAMIVTNTAALTTAKEERQKAQDAFNAASLKHRSARTGKMGSGLIAEMKAVTTTEKQVSDLDAKQQSLNNQLALIKRYVAQIQSRMTELGIKPKAEPPPSPPPPQ